MKLNVIFPLLLILFVACTNNSQQKKDDPKEVVMIHSKAEPGNATPGQCVTMVFDLVKGTITMLAMLIDMGNAGMEHQMGGLP